jgi:hypothetical protein
MDYSWHVQQLLRGFGCGPLADPGSVWKGVSQQNLDRINPGGLA